MLRIIHTADLHLTSGDDRVYGYAVLDEIIAVANARNADFLILAGDVFNRFGDLDTGRNDFKNRVGKLRKECEIIYIAGNHENLERKNRKISAFDLGIPRENIIDSDRAPLVLLDKEQIEFLCVPHQTDYSALSTAETPPRTAKPRLAIAHGILTGTTLANLVDDEEEQAVVIDASLFAKHQVDYVCLGHIHKQSQITLGKIKGRYPGSPRVWRKGEVGPRQINYLEIDGAAVRDELITLASAGEFHEIDFFVSLDDNHQALERLPAEFSRHDYIFVTLHGIAEDAQAIEKIKSEIVKKYASRCRLLEFDDASVEIMAGISSSALAKNFLAAWQDGAKLDRSPFEQKAWLKARELGLLQIKQQLEK